MRMNYEKLAVCVGQFMSSHVMDTVARARGGGEEHLGLHCDVPTWGTGRVW